MTKSKHKHRSFARWLAHKRCSKEQLCNRSHEVLFALCTILTSILFGMVGLRELERDESMGGSGIYAAFIAAERSAAQQQRNVRL